MRALKRIFVEYDFIPKGSTIKKTGTLKFVSSGVQHYFNSQHLMYKLGKDSRAFYDYLCERMDHENSITIDAALKASFVTHFSVLTSKKKKIKASSLSTYAAKLSDLGLLIPIGNLRSAFYCINPKFAFKGTKAGRVALLQLLIEQMGAAGQSLHGLLDTTEAEFLAKPNTPGRNDGRDVIRGR